MDWQEIKKRYQSLCDAAEAGSEVDDAWLDFVSIVQEAKQNPPYHLQPLLDNLRKIQNDRPPDTIAILDHGCGGCLTLYFLAALGYTNVYGVDIGGRIDLHNRIFTTLFGFKERRIYEYDGQKLPLPDGSVDYIFSQQVLEHVRNSVLLDYYSEEHRVLKQGGGVYHQVPHRFTPYDSHSRTWFIHYFPRAIRFQLYKLCGKDPVYIERILHLRTPFFHRRKMVELFGNCHDLTVDRLLSRNAMLYYDGPRTLRSFIGTAAAIPIIGSVFRLILRELIMLDTFSIKTLAK